VDVKNVLSEHSEYSVRVMGLISSCTVTTAAVNRVSSDLVLN